MEAAKSPKSAEAFDHKILKEVGELPIKNEKTFLPFRSLFADKDPQERQLIIFIRHFFCGVSEIRRRGTRHKLKSANPINANSLLSSLRY